MPPLAKERRPRVTLKAAITLDGHTAARSGDSKWISGEAARRAAHKLRAEVDAVLVGVGTVLRDDPELTVRHVRGTNPLRVVLDSRLRTPAESRIVQAGPGLRTLILHGPKAQLRKRRALAAAGVALLGLGVDRDGRLRLDAVLRALHELGVEELLVEGGPTVHGAFLDAGVVDRVWIALAPALLGDARALPLRFTRVRRLGPDLLIEGSLSPAATTPRGAPRRARGGRTR